MQGNFDLPFISCQQCKGNLVLHIENKVMRISTLQIKCKQCGLEEDMLGNIGSTYRACENRFKKITNEVVKNFLKRKESLPNNRDEWADVIKNPKHPFTAALLSGFALILMESSGFGIYTVITWILGNLILNPVSWVLIPLVVAIGFTYRQKFKQNKLSSLKKRLNEIEQRMQAGKITPDQHESEKNTLLAEFFR